MRISIIGGGASGTLLAINLLRQRSAGPLEINLVEKRGAGGGVAFSTPHSFHLLNVPAGKMSALPDEPDHLLNWLRAEGHEFGASDFVPRRLFGRYLTQLLTKARNEAGPDRRLFLLNDTAIDLSVNERSAEVILESGEVLPSDRVVLAFGNFLPPHPTVHDLKFISADNYIHDVWTEDALANVKPEHDVLIVGTGLSMVDVVLRLRSNGHRGKISALSTRGLLPAVHKLGSTYPSFDDELTGLSRITGVFRVVRRHIRNAEANGSDWRAVIDSLRPHTQQIWQQLPVSEKRYFLQHLRRHCNVARHRKPPAPAELLDEMRKKGALDILSGRLRHISVDDRGRFLVNYAAKGEQSYITIDVLINCIGAQSNFARVNSELVHNLLSAGTIRCDPIRQGLDATPDGRLIGADDRPSSILRTIGTALKGTLLESTAIPEIRIQARDLAADMTRTSDAFA